jgi:tRNA pseudouridine55 synthase
MDAVFNVYKPSGPTSHDVVARLRRASGERRIGHAGTLDPLAEGVLVVATGRATRLIEYLAGADKAYQAEVTLGVETTTYDAEGEVVAERPVDGLARAAIEAALAHFGGETAQRPPAYSAVSGGGRRLYDLARRGEAVEAPPRRVTISALELVGWSPPVARLNVECSKGTYIRSLAHDLGAALGCGGHLSRLVRTRAGDFLADRAVPLAELEAHLQSGSWQRFAIAPGDAVRHLPAVEVAAGDLHRILNGVAVPAALESQAPADARGLARAYAAGRFLGILRLVQASGQTYWRPEKILARPS